MTQDEIIRMAREAGFSFETGQDMRDNIPALERFAALVAAHEREKQAEQEPFDMDDHPPHRLCECRKCMEYFTPLPDCDAFAASGKPIAEQTNTQFMEGYRIGLAEMREKCAKACEEIEQDRWNLYKGRPPYTGSESGRADPHEQGVSMGAGECAAAIRARGSDAG